MSINWFGECKPTDSTKSCSSQDTLSAYIKRHGTRISEFNNSKVNVLQCGEHKTSLLMFWGFLVVQMVKNLPAMRETWVPSLGWEGPLRREWLPTPVFFLPGEFHGQRSLVGYSPWGCKELDTTERFPPCSLSPWFLLFLFPGGPCLRCRPQPHSSPYFL